MSPSVPIGMLPIAQWSPPIELVPEPVPVAVSVSVSPAVDVAVVSSGGALEVSSSPHPKVRASSPADTSRTTLLK